MMISGVFIDRIYGVVIYFFIYLILGEFEYFRFLKKFVFIELLD